MTGPYSRLCFVALFVLSGLVAQGCNVVRITLNTPLKPEDVAFITPGQTTLTEVIDKLGSPDSLTDSNNGVVAIYRFLDMKYSRVNFGWLVKPWSPVDPDLIMSSMMPMGSSLIIAFSDMSQISHSIPIHFDRLRCSPHLELPLHSSLAIIPPYGSGAAKVFLVLYSSRSRFRVSPA